MQNVVAGCVAVVLVIMALIVYSQKHHHCWNGHVLKNLHGHVLKKTGEPCGSLSPSI